MTNHQFTHSAVPTPEELFRQTKMFINYKVHGFFSHSSVTITLSRPGDIFTESIADVSWSSGGRSEKELEDNVQAAMNHAAAVQHAAALAGFLRDEITRYYEEVIKPSEQEAA